MKLVKKWCLRAICAISWQLTPTGSCACYDEGKRAVETRSRAPSFCASFCKTDYPDYPHGGMDAQSTIWYESFALRRDGDFYIGL